MRLEIELVPKSCWWSNVRSQVTAAQWEVCKRFVRQRSGDRCEICNGKGHRWPVECHEIWQYDADAEMQTLVGLIALCPDCHAAKHIGRTLKTGPEARAQRILNHIMTVNRWGYAHLEAYLETVFAVWSIRSSLTWGLNVSYLKEIGLDLPRYTWEPKERVPA